MRSEAREKDGREKGECGLSTRDEGTGYNECEFIKTNREHQKRDLHSRFLRYLSSVQNTGDSTPPEIEGGLKFCPENFNILLPLMVT